MIPVMDLIPSLRTYEVIEPSEIRGLVFDGPDSTRVHPREITVALQAFGVKYELQLERVDDLFGAEYGHYSWDVDAARVTVESQTSARLAQSSRAVRLRKLSPAARSRKAVARVARAYHSPEFHAVMRIAGRKRPYAPSVGSSSCSIQP